MYAELNEEQQAAVSATEGYVRVIAGAGSGKTRTLSHRFAFLVNELGISPSSILCLTFSNRAAGEMRHRIRRMLPDRDLGYICTFHSFSVTLLREECHFLQYPKTFFVMDNLDKTAMLEGVFEELSITLKEMTIQKASDFIGGRKSVSDYVPLVIHPAFEELLALSDAASTLEEKVFYRYLYEQRKSFALDFDDLLLFALYVLRHNREIREKWQRRLEYIMIDEYQDIDKDQYALSEILSGYHHNLFVVGDPDQTIYTWRGADVKFVLEFAAQHPEAQTIFMNRNYRSTPQILQAANHLIDYNRNRLKKDLIAMGEDQEKPLYFHAGPPEEEAAWLVEQFGALHAAGVSYAQMAVLYRAHYVSRQLEEKLIEARIPYTLYSGVEFYQRKEVKDILCYLRMLDSGDDLAFTRVINEPRRGIGKRRMQFLKDYAAAHGCTLLQALRETQTHELMRRTQAAAFIALIEKFRQLAATLPLNELLSQLMQESGYEEALRLNGESERLDNLAELKQAIYQYEKSAGEEVTLQDYLEHAALFTNLDQETRPETLRLMTVHTAKGLEFDYVFLCGLSEGIFPSRRTLTRENLEEERRLAYVAVTRAKKRLFISDAEGMNLDGSYRYPSRFILNIGFENMETVRPIPQELLNQTERKLQSWEKQADVLAQRAGLSVGARIRHPHFGEGTILEVHEGDKTLVIRFDRLPTPRTLGMDAKIVPVR